LQTYGTYISYQAPGPGTYHVTVVAFNHALDSSQAVCSDGITIDSSPVGMSEIVVTSAIVQPGLMKDMISNDVYFLHRNREVQQLYDVSQQCRYAINARDKLYIF